LRAIDKVSSQGLPVLGVNFGSLGYLTEIDPGSLFMALKRFFENDYLIEERMTLNITIESRQLTSQGYDGFHTSFVALNEMVVEKLSSGHVIRVEVCIGNEQFLTYEADGIIASTPTGSTAYNFSSRGPVLSPSLRAIIITPISPHMLFDRSLVLEPHETVSFKIVDGPSAAVMVDGVQKAQIDPGDRVICTCYETPARLVTFGKKNFHQILKMKFGLSSKQMGI
jgi:NAD+ kinase